MVHCDLSQPPEQFNHGPLPTHIVRYISPEEMHTKFEIPLSFALGEPVKLCGMSDVMAKPMVIYIRSDLKNVHALLTHEEGHLRGWRHKTKLPVWLQKH